MARSDDRPIIVSGGDRMITVELPEFTKPKGGSHSLDALPANGPFKRIVFTNVDTGKKELDRAAGGNWTFTIE